MSNNMDLQEIANGELMATDKINDINIDQTKAQLRIFLLAQAQKELERVIKLTNILDILQDKYQEKVQDYIKEHDDETAIEYLTTKIENITSYLNRSNSIISGVASNEKLMNLLVVDLSQTLNIDTSAGADTSKSLISEALLNDPVSRSKVRDAVMKALSSMEELSSAASNVLPNNSDT